MAGWPVRKLQVVNPYSQEKLLELSLATKEDLDESFIAAREAQKSWALIAPAARAAVMLKAVKIFDQRREEIIEWIIAESGSTRIKAQIEWGAARAITLEASSFPSRVHGLILPNDIPGKESRVYRKPLGVVGVISPWNFPLHLSQRSVAPALALGNAVVIKPASDTPVTGGLLIAHIFEEAGSTEVGRNIGRLASGGKYLKRVALELGGNSLFVVLADADVELAVKALPYGDPSKADTVVGPVINAKQLQGLLQKIETAKAEGAKMLVGGDPQGNVLPPHVFGNVTADMEIAREEIFGPVVGIQAARDEQHALELANQSDYGLSSAVFSGSLERGVRFAQGIHAGMTHVNDMPVNDAPNAAFGGEKSSGLGRFNGEWAIEEFTTDHWITVQHEPRRYPF